jgi:hypothetical protein
MIAPAKLLLFAVAFLWLLLAAPSSTEAALSCRGQFGLNKGQCQQKMNACAQQGIIMKWSGRGCRELIPTDQLAQD